MDLHDFVMECRFCDIHDEKKVAELLNAAADLAESVINAREKSGQKEHIPYERIRQMYNNICTKLPKARSVTASRQRLINSCYNKHITFDDFERAFRAAADTPFLNGSNSRGWRADFDWIINPDNIIKVLEGKYSDSKPKADADTPSYDISLFMEKARRGVKP